jgi:hypothetical protein
VGGVGGGGQRWEGLGRVRRHGGGGMWAERRGGEVPPAAAVLVRQKEEEWRRKGTGGRRKPEKKKEVEETTWVHHYLFARGARSPANDSGIRLLPGLWPPLLHRLNQLLQAPWRSPVVEPSPAG